MCYCANGSLSCAVHWMQKTVINEYIKGLCSNIGLRMNTTFATISLNANQIFGKWKWISQSETETFLLFLICKLKLWSLFIAKLQFCIISHSIKRLNKPERLYIMVVVWLVCRSVGCPAGMTLIWDRWRKYLVQIFDISWENLGHILGISWGYLRHILAIN